MHVLGGEHQVAHDPGVVRQLLVHAHGVVHAAGGGQGVGIGAHAAGALGEVLGVARVAALEDDLQARKSWELERTSLILPFSTSTSMRRWPSMRVNGSTVTGPV
jgi:hypothetical protein